MFRTNAKIILSFLILITLLNTNCEKNPAGPENPQIGIDKTELIFNSIDNYSVLIENKGAGEMSWNVENKPDWIKLSTENGTIVGGKDTIIVSLSQLIQLSENAGKIIINSNGGAAEITVKTELIINIHAGMGAADIEIGESVSRVKTVHGSNFSTWNMSWYESGFLRTLFKMQFTSKGFNFNVFTNSNMLSNSDTVSSVTLYSPFKGVTEKLIGIGSSLINVRAKYGSPDKINNDYYDYSSIGLILYISDADTSIIDGINVKNKE